MLNVCLVAAARSFGPAVIYGDWSSHWIFWVGPFTGAIAAWLVYDFTFRPSHEPVSFLHCKPPCMLFDMSLYDLCYKPDVYVASLHAASTTCNLHSSNPFPCSFRLSVCIQFYHSASLFTLPCRCALHCFVCLHAHVILLAMDRHSSAVQGIFLALLL